MYQEVYGTKEFKKWARRRVFLVEIDFPKEKPQSPELKRQNEPLKLQYEVRGFPTMHLIDATGKRLSPDISRVARFYGKARGAEAWIEQAESFLK